VLRTAAWVVLGASGLIGMSSCSSGHPAPASSASSTSTSTSTQSASPSASLGLAGGSAAASDRIGPLTEEFTTPLPTDPAKAGVIEGWRESQVAWDQSVQVWRVLPGASAYIKGNAFTRLHTAVSTDLKYHVILSGTDRLYDTNVTSLTANGATVTSCDDGSKVLDENPSTGKKYPNTPGSPVTFFVIWQLVPASGHWAITSYDLVAAPDPRERVCAAS
jgi:hypothetical protein